MITLKNALFKSQTYRNTLRTILIALAAASLFTSSSISACTIYFTNNKPEPVLITLADNSEAILVAMNKTKMFGDGTKHAEFTVWQKSKGSDRFKRVAFLKQHGCNRGKKIDINMSDIQSGVVNKNLFTATFYK